MSRSPAHGLLLTVLVAASTSVGAIDELAVSLGRLDGERWSAHGVRILLDSARDDPVGGQLRMERLILPEPIGEVTGLRVACRSLEISAARIRCRRGTLSGDPVLGEPLAGAVQLDYGFDGSLSLTADLERIADGDLRLELSLTPERRTLRIKGSRLDASRLLALSRHFVPTGGYEAQGPVSLEATLDLGPDGRFGWRGALRGHALAFSDPSGTIAGEGLTFDLSARGAPTPEGWRLIGSLNLEEGGVYADPVFVEAGEHPITLSAAGDWHAETATLTLERFDYRHEAALATSGSLRLQPRADQPLALVDAHIERARFPSAYRTYLQPWLFGTALGDLQTEGEAAGAVIYREGRLEQIELQAIGLGLTDRKQRFSLLGLNGEIAWSPGGPARDWDLAWRSGSLYRIPFGEAALALRVQDRSASLTRPLRVPIFDGALAVEHWAVERLGDPAMTVAFDARLEPVSLAPLSAALDWPSLSGKVSGAIPNLSYAQGRLEVGGLLTVRAFDGVLTMEQLQLEQPFGLVPRLSADISLDNLDLEAVTRTFSLGRIEGRLEGYVRELRMTSWEPVAFDAAFANPPGDDSRHRISQRAANNLLRIGGGVGGALSTGILGVFESFPYDRLGLSCRLERGICLMDGIEPAENGYYIVKGRGLPHLDIIGHNHRVDWETLLARIKAVVAGGAPVVR
jgi:hypothetical protein